MVTYKATEVEWYLLWDTWEAMAEWRRLFTACFSSSLNGNIRRDDAAL